MREIGQFRAALIIPTYNEGKHIEAVLDSLLDQCPEQVVDIIVVDGGSEDGTPDIVRQVQRRAPKVRLIDNPARLQAPGVNLAAGLALPQANVLIRIDAHAGYPADFIRSLLQTLAATEAESVVVRLRSVGGDCFQKAVAVISNTLLGTGGAVHRMGVKSRFVDHGHHAAFLRQAFSEVGGYDETFVAAEDAELDHRLLGRGGRIWFAADIIVDYYPRETPSKLAKQYYRNGRGRAQTVLKHQKIRLRQLLPPLFLIALLASPFIGALWEPFLFVPVCYTAICVGTAVALAVREKSLCMLAVVAIAPIIHLCWAAGFLRSLAAGLISGRAASTGV